MARNSTAYPTERGTAHAGIDGNGPASSSLGATRPRRDFAAVLAALRQSRETTHNIRHGGVARRLPSRTQVAEVVNALTAALFPTHYGRPELGADGIDLFVCTKLKSALADLEEQIGLSLPLSAGEEQPALAAARRIARDIAEEFASQLPEIRAALVCDLRAAHDNEAGAASMPEILLGYPGMVAIMCYRLARPLHLLGAPLVARLITLVAHSRTGIDIHPGAEIGLGFSIDHGTGIVIGETAIIGNNVRLCEGVRLGASRLPPGAAPLPVRGSARHPVIEDNVFIFSGATLLGRITVGKGSVIGGNVWLTRSVPPKSNIVQTQIAGLAAVRGEVPT